MTAPSVEVRRAQKARMAATFDFAQMAEIIYGGKDGLSAHLNAHARISSPASINNADNMVLPCIYGSINREESLLLGLKAGVATFEDDVDNKSDVFRFTAYDGKAANANPLGLTLLLFVPFLKLQGTDEQVLKWAGKAERGEIIGCYSQTELGHGSFVGGIETTATFDRDTDEFVIHSPNLSSTKYWPGALGLIATHSITMARLIIDNTDHGVHAFVMQIRSLSDGKPLPGIELGDIGMKMSYNGTDNGYAIFNHVRIPRTNLLMRYSTVSRSGAYTSVPLRQKLIYGGMLNSRSIVVSRCTFQLAQALTIATRYSVIRTQGRYPGSDTLERPIISYQHQKHRLLTLISRSYVNVFISQHSAELYRQLGLQQAKGDHNMLPFMHMLFCGLKAWISQTASDGAEEARKMCGGHGYVAISGLLEITSSLAAMCTLEGENFVMWAQVTRYLLKGLDGVFLPSDMTYMSSYVASKCAAKGEEFLDHNILLEIFQERAKTLAIEVHALVKAAEAEGKTRAEAENLCSPQLIVASRAHIEVYILSASMSRLTLLSQSTPPTPPAIITVLRDLVSLFALTTIASPFAPFSASFLTSGFISQGNLTEMRVQIDILLEKLQVDALALTDAWAFSDAKLASAIGCWDGDVYNRVMAWTRQIPVNVEARKTDGVWKDGWNIVSGFMERGKRRGGAKL